MKACVFKCSQHEGRECCFPPNFQQFCCVKNCEINPSQSFCGPCEHLEKQAFTRKNYENQQKTRAVWRGEYFFREIKYVYIRARSVYSQNGFDLFSVICPLRLPGRTRREVFFTSRRLFRQARRVNKSTSGLLGTTRGLFGKALHHLKIFLFITNLHPTLQSSKLYDCVTKEAVS